MPSHLPRVWTNRILAAGGIALLSAVVLGSTVVGVRWFGGREGTERAAGDRDASPTVQTRSERGYAKDAASRDGSRAMSEVAAETTTETGAADASSWRSDLGSHQAWTGAMQTSSAERAPDRPARRNEVDSLVASLPPSMIELARNTVWDERATESLDRLLLLAFDTDSDLVLDDFERITAVKAMRDAMWPTAAGDTQAFVRDREARGRGAGSSDAPLRFEDLRLHHDVDESRRLDHALERERHDHAPADRNSVDSELRAAVMQEFRLVDDERLTTEEFARFLRAYRAGSEPADLNRDGRADEADLRLFLDIASPIRAE